MRSDQVIDWAGVRARLSRAVAGKVMTAEDERQILRRRARNLATPPQLAAPATIVDVLGFTLGGAPYAVETRFLREVTRLADLTPVPGAPDLLLGLVSVRGEVVAVFDLRRLLGTGASSDGASRLLVLGGENVELAVAIDAAGDVDTIDVAALRAPPLAQRLLRGITPELALLDGAALLDDERTRVDQA